MSSSTKRMQKCRARKSNEQLAAEREKNRVRMRQVRTNAKKKQSMDSRHEDKSVTTFSSNSLNSSSSNSLNSLTRSTSPMCGWERMSKYRSNLSKEQKEHERKRNSLRIRLLRAKQKGNPFLNAREVLMKKYKDIDNHFERHWRFCKNSLYLSPLKPKGYDKETEKLTCEERDEIFYIMCDQENFKCKQTLSKIQQEIPPRYSLRHGSYLSIARVLLHVSRVNSKVYDAPWNKKNLTPYEKCLLQQIKDFKIV